MLSNFTIIYGLIGTVPALIWLSFFLKQDAHPERTKKILEIFLLGVIMSVPVLIVEQSISSVFCGYGIAICGGLIVVLVSIFLQALAEEFFKYVPVKLRVFDSAHFDEPIDAMIYMIVSGLGFATIENIIASINASIVGGFQNVVLVNIIRFLFPIFIHALCSGLVGYFAARSICNPTKGKFLMPVGFLLSASAHGLFNFFVLNLNSSLPRNIILSEVGIILLIFVLIIVSIRNFRVIKTLESTCVISKKTMEDSFFARLTGSKDVDDSQAEAAPGEFSTSMPEEPQEVGQLTIDMFQTEDAIVIQSTIAGISAKDLDIVVKNDTITITGQRRRPQDIPQEDYILQECYWGAFTRTIALPEKIKSDEVRASIKQGILSVLLPKLERIEPTKIQIREE